MDGVVEFLQVKLACLAAALGGGEVQLFVFAGGERLFDGVVERILIEGYGARALDDGDRVVTNLDAAVGEGERDLRRRVLDLLFEVALVEDSAVGGLELRTAEKGFYVVEGVFKEISAVAGVKGVLCGVRCGEIGAGLLAADAHLAARGQGDGQRPVVLNVDLRGNQRVRRLRGGERADGDAVERRLGVDDRALLRVRAETGEAGKQRGDDDKRHEQGLFAAAERRGIRRLALRPPSSGHARTRGGIVIVRKGVAVVGLLRGLGPLLRRGLF